MSILTYLGRRLPYDSVVTVPHVEMKVINLMVENNVYEEVLHVNVRPPLYIHEGKWPTVRERWTLPL